MITQLGLAYGPALLLFFAAVYFTTVQSRLSLAVASLSMLACFLLVLQTANPNPSRGFLNWIPLLLPFFAVVGFLPRRVWKWASLVVCLIVSSIFVSKILSVNPRWSLNEQWLNGSFLIVLPLILTWYAMTRHREEGEFPAFQFGLFGFVILISLVSYIVAGTSKLGIMLGVIGILCAAGFLATVIKRKRSDWGPLGFLLLGTAWMATVYVHYFTEKLPLFVTAFLLFTPPAVSLLHLSDRSLKWKILIPVLVVVLGASAASTFIYLDGATDEYGY
ncbi:MAG: hypothetical protein AAGA96_09390 [Verrucomicrobiota bacterium]